MKRARSETEPTLFEVDVRDWLRSSHASAPGLHISEPREVGCFSRAPDRVISYGSRGQLAPYKDPALGADLGADMDNFREKQSFGDGVEPVVRALRKAGFSLREAEFVSYRNNLNKIAGTPYNDRDAWDMDATRVGGTTFLDVRKLDDGRGNDERQKRFMYFGYRFESLCTGAENEPTDANSEFCSIVRLRLGAHRICFGAEIDAEDKTVPSDKGPLRRYVELKTMREPRNDRDWSSAYRFRFCKYWVQSYLAGVRKVVIGMRNDHGILTKVEHFPTSSLPKLARENLQSNRPGGRPVWDPFVILNFLDLILSRVLEVTKHNVGCTIRVRYDPSERKVTASLLKDSQFPLRMQEEVEQWS